MLFPHIKLRSRRISFLLLLALLLGSGVLIFARWKSSDSNLIEPVASSQSQPSSTQLEVELVTVTPTGFEPGEITRPPGRFLLAVDNQSGLNELDLYLERETEGRLNVALDRRGKLKWREILDLPPGRYILRAGNDESWRCNITLTRR